MQRRARRRWACRLAVLLTIVCLTPAHGATLTVEEMMDFLELTKSERRQIDGGEVVVRTLAQEVQHQIPTLVAFRVPIALDEVMALYGDGQAMQAVKRHLGLGRPSLPIVASEWEEASFRESETAEIESILQAAPGLDLNLSTKEFASLRKQLNGVGDGDRVAAVSAAYRGILQERFRAYVEGGLGAIEPYDRGAGSFTNPAAEILVEWKLARDFLSQHFPDFVAAVESYPREQPASVLNQYFWVKEDFTSKFSSRVAFELEHQTWQETDDYVLVSTRQFFVGHTYTAQQITTVVLPSQDGVVIFSVTAVASDLVARYVPMIALPIGKKIMRAEMKEYYESLLQSARP